MPDRIRSEDEDNYKTKGFDRRRFLLGGTAIAAGTAIMGATAQTANAQQSAMPATRPSGRKPNILVIWGDDIGWQNISAYGLGTMGYTTPNIDRIGNEGIKFVDHYAQPSCTAGRAAFITGQLPIRSGMTTVGAPGNALGLSEKSPCLAEVLKEQGYATGQFGKNHLGDRNEHLPTVHGFDEFFGVLYHLNVYEQPEYLDQQRFAESFPGGKAAYDKKYGIRGVLHSLATDTDDPTTDERSGRVGKQKIEDTGPLTMKRMEDFDAVEVIPRAQEFMRKSKEDGKPFFVWLNTSRMHLYTHVNEKWRYSAAKYTHDQDLHGDGMLQHDHDIGGVLDWLKANGLEEDTIIWYSTDNGPEHSSWPYGGTTPFRGEKMTTYEGGVRVISMLRWPGVVKPNQTLNGIQSHEDMFVSFAAAANVPDVIASMKTSKSQYIDGVNNLGYWKGEVDKSSRDTLLYYRESQLNAVRIGPWKLHLATSENYYDKPVAHAPPLFFNIRSDPFESYSSLDSNGHMAQRNGWLFEPLIGIIEAHLATLKEYPPVQGGFSPDLSTLVPDFLKQMKQTQAGPPK